MLRLTQALEDGPFPGLCPTWEGYMCLLFVLAIGALPLGLVVAFMLAWCGVIWR